jgi:uncharacterized membrane protein
MDRVQIKEKAKSLLSKNYGGCIIASLVASLLGGGGNSAPSFNLSSNINSETMSDSSQAFLNIPAEEMLIYIVLIIIGSILLITFLSAIGCVIHAFLGYQMRVGSCRYFLKYRKDNPTGIEELFNSYKDKTFLNVAKVAVVKNISISLWSLLFIIPGIIKSYEYAAVDYILAVNPTMNRKRAFELSKKIMNGHKAELFELNFSFLGWHLLSALTLGILEIVYVGPYYRIAETEFFAFVREDAIGRGIISANDIPDYSYFIAPNTVYQNPALNQNSFSQENNVAINGVSMYNTAQNINPTITQGTSQETSNTSSIT